jgi:hypothetical protein
MTYLKEKCEGSSSRNYDRIRIVKENSLNYIYAIVAVAYALFADVN